MKKTIFAAVLLSLTFAAGARAQQKAWMSRYWDGCKPSCSWVENATASGATPCKECDKSDKMLPAPTGTVGQAVSSCEGGTSYTCWDMVPFVDTEDPNLAYAFAATPGILNSCGKCFELKFDGGRDGPWTPYGTHKAIQGKTLIVLSSNIGYDVNSHQFDVLVPGGGVGAYNSFSDQIGVDAARLGQNHGGLLADCEQSVSQSVNWNPDSMTAGRYQKCLRDKCNDVFSKPEHALLKQGCLFYADWFMAANNPTADYREVPCPQILVDRYNGAVTGAPPTVDSLGQIVGKGGDGGTGAKRAAARAAGSRPQVTLKAGAKGFTALLPAGHGYTSYKLIDLQGREIERGAVAPGVASLRFGELKGSVLFLKLEGKNSAVVFRAVAY
jgi:hypothetical protein